MIRPRIGQHLHILVTIFAESAGQPPPGPQQERLPVKLLFLTAMVIAGAFYVLSGAASYAESAAMNFIYDLL
jgi:hypothetical protein